MHCCDLEPGCVCLWLLLCVHAGGWIAGCAFCIVQQNSHCTHYRTLFKWKYSFMVHLYCEIMWVSYSDASCFFSFDIENWCKRWKKILLVGGEKGEIRVDTHLHSLIVSFPDFDMWNVTKYSRNHEPRQLLPRRRLKSRVVASLESFNIEFKVNCYLIFFNFILVNRSHVQS